MHPALVAVENFELIFSLGQKQNLRSLARTYQNWSSRLPDRGQVGGMGLVAEDFLQVLGFPLQILIAPVGHSAPGRWRRVVVGPRENIPFERRGGGKIRRC